MESIQTIFAAPYSYSWQTQLLANSHTPFALLNSAAHKSRSRKTEYIGNWKHRQPQPKTTSLYSHLSICGSSCNGKYFNADCLKSHSVCATSNDTTNKNVKSDNTWTNIEFPMNWCSIDRIWCFYAQMLQSTEYGRGFRSRLCENGQNEHRVEMLC